MKDIISKINDKKFDVIECPVCKAQYLPAEIYLPKSFIGNPQNINKDHLTGKIEDFYGQSMDKEEHFICEKCNTPFKIKAKVDFKVVAENDINFDTLYASKRQKKLHFKED